MVQRLSVRENEKPETARKRFDGQLAVRAWTTPSTRDKTPDQRDPKAPYWWDGAEDATNTWVAMARAEGKI